MQNVLEPAEVLASRPDAEVPLWIEGAAHTGSDVREVREPATDLPLARIHLAGGDEVERAVAAAVEGQQAWSRMPLTERMARLQQLAQRILDRADAFGELDARDTGTPIRTMRAGAKKGAAYLQMAAGVAMEMQGRTIPASASGWHMTFPKPLGVVAGISAFNHPTLFACQKIGPALLAGNAVVLKVGDQAPLSGTALASLTADLLPPGALNVLAGPAEVGERLVAHPDVAAVTLTGSVRTGQRVQQTAAASGHFKRLLLELGGKNPILVFPDADLDEAAAAAVRGMNYTRNQGQSCGSTSRLIVHDHVRDDLVERVVAHVTEIELGLPELEETQMGCLIDKDHRRRTLAAIRAAQDQGAELLVGGRTPTAAHLERGAFLEPTVFDHVTAEMDVARQELFAPVLAVLSSGSEREMIEMANDTDYGLTASIWTNDISRALSAADQLDAGYLWINDVETRYPGVPHGGWKLSGTGLEQALTEEIRTFTRLKSVNIAVRGSTA